MDCPTLKWLLLASHDEVENKPWSECDRFTVQSGYSCTELVATATVKVKERDKRSRGQARHRGFSLGKRDSKTNVWRKSIQPVTTGYAHISTFLSSCKNLVRLDLCE